MDTEETRVSIFGVRGAGKTCLIYAMAQVMQAGAKYEDAVISLIANDIKQQSKLNSGYKQLAMHKWPQGSKKTTNYNFRVRLQLKDFFGDIIPSIIIRDYKGGILENTGEEEGEDAGDFDELLKSFSDSRAIIFLVDGETILKALDPLDVDVDHRVPLDAYEILYARNQISFVENLFLEYKKNNTIPPVMIVITKADLFLSEQELEKGKSLIKQYIPSIFAKGSGVDASITSVSLGDNLSKGEDDTLLGNLILNTSRNIHIPVIFALYAYLDYKYDLSSPEDQKLIDDILRRLRGMVENKVDFYQNGSLVFAID